MFKSKRTPASPSLSCDNLPASPLSPNTHHSHISHMKTTLRTNLHTTLHPNTFPLFPNLPTELRLQIWEAALPPPTLHELYPIYPPSPSTPSPHPYKTRLRTNAHHPPSLLHTTHESRTVALSHLRLMRYETFADPPTSPDNTDRVNDIHVREVSASITPFYYHPTRDTLFLNCVASIFLDIRWSLIIDETPRRIVPIKGWENIALDSLHMAFVAVVAGDVPGSSRMRMGELFPDMRWLGVVVDRKGSGRRRLRASLRPGGRTKFRGEVRAELEVDGWEEILGYLDRDYGVSAMKGRESAEGETDRRNEEGCAVRKGTMDRPELKFMRVRRKRFYVGLRQGLRYYYVGGCQILEACKRKVFGDNRQPAIYF